MNPEHTTLNFLKGGGEMGELTRNFNWETTSVGEPGTWSHSLQTMVGVVLHSAFPMFLFWGDDYICFYNDAYRVSLGNNGRHPLVGKKGKEGWGETWEYISGLIQQVRSTGDPVWFEDENVPIFRNGKTENVYWTFGYSPVYDGNEMKGFLVTCTETTKRVATSRELLSANVQIHNQLQLLSYFDQSPVGLAVFSKDRFIFQAVNAFYGEIVGRDPEELKNKPLYDALPELAGQGFEALLQNVIDTGDPYIADEVPVKLIKNEKLETIFVNLTYQPLRNAAGEIEGLLVVVTDVTQQVSSRLKVEESEAHLQLVRDAVPAMIFYMDKEQRYQSYNGVFMEWFGVDATEAIGKTTREFIGEAAYAIASRYLDRAYAGEQVQYHMHAPQRIGGEKWLSIVYTPHKLPAGEVVGVIVHATDITEYVLATQKIEQKEKELRDLITASPIGICVVAGIEARIEEVNDQFIVISGKKPEQFVDATYWEVFPEVKERFAKVLEDVFLTGIKYSTAETEVVLIRNGVPENIFVTFEYIPLFDKDVVTKVIVMVVEVSHQVETRRQIENAVIERTRDLKESNLQLKRSNEELEQFAYIASHDLQEPVRKISTFTQMLENSFADMSEQAKGYFAKIYNSTDRMSKLIRDVLAYSSLRGDAGNFEPVDLNNVVEMVKADYDIVIAESGALIACKDLPVLKAIPGQMVQLFSNLLSNSLKYRSLTESPVISISSVVISDKTTLRDFGLDPALDYCQIRFADNGIGFAKEFVEKIFRIFQRLHGKTEYEGTGIGLAICLRIVQNHGGHIFAEVGDNGGAVFNILLPLRS